MIQSKVYETFKVYLEWDDEHVFGPSPLAEYLAPMIKASDRKLVLDIGCGTGFLGLVAAKQGAEKVVAIDNNPYAIQCTKNNINKNNLQDNFIIINEDLNKFNYIFPFDLIICNPPSLPVPPSIYHASSYVYNYDYEGGIDGRDLLDKVLTFTKDNLSDSGELLLLQTEFADTNKTIKDMNKDDFMCTVIGEKYFPLILNDSYDRNAYLEERLRKFGKEVIKKDGQLMEKISILSFQRGSHNQ